MTLFERFSIAWADWIVAASWQLAAFILVIAILCRCLPRGKSQLKHALWLLVLVKVFLPPTFSLPLSIGHWGVGPVMQVQEHWGIRSARAPMTEIIAAEREAAVKGSDVPTDSWTSRLAAIWLAGMLTFWLVVVGSYLRLLFALRRATVIDEGPLRVMLEQLAMRLKLRSVPDLLSTDIVSSPFLCGLWHPRIVLPSALPGQLDEDELRAILAHELVHWKRRDTWIGWAQVVVQGLFWFHPFIWWANSQLRHERECVCDATALQAVAIPNDRYVEAIVRVLTVTRGRSAVAGSLAGVFERGTKLQFRIEEIMSATPFTKLSVFSRMAILATALFLLPMAPGGGERSALRGDETAAPAKEEPATAEDPPVQKEETPYPVIVKTSPASGETDVDPGLSEITVTFDRPMGKGMSWTGELPVDRSRKAEWRDERTCVLPVHLKRGAMYRVGINSKSYQNFRSADGIATPPAVIRFTTKGATPQIERQIRVPKIVKLVPVNGDTAVDPSITEIQVTFDLPMSAGMSWTGGGERFPTVPDGAQPEWSKDGRTCTLPVSLQADREYRLGLNSLSHNNFQSRWGVPLVPVEYSFHTAKKQ